MPSPPGDITAWVMLHPLEAALFITGVFGLVFVAVQFLVAYPHLAYQMNLAELCIGGAC